MSFKIKMNVMALIFVQTVVVSIPMVVFYAFVIQDLRIIYSVHYIVKVNYLKKSKSKDSYDFLIDINECLSFDNCTGNNEICENTIGSFRCICASGYRRDSNGNCISKYINDR
jgi:hypothetical protein